MRHSCGALRWRLARVLMMTVTTSSFAGAFQPSYVRNRPLSSISALSSSDEVSEGVRASRRQALQGMGGLVGGTICWIDPVQAADSGAVPIQASWSAVDGLNSLQDDRKFVSFDASAYKAMKDDSSRTPLFQQAIFRRLGPRPEECTVLDLGTGPFALFAIMAAELGAGRVFAVEANEQAAQLARENIERRGFSDVITVLEGFSSDITLPDGIKADFCVAEIVGSIATEEGAYATVVDAHARLVKRPELSSSWIPCQIQTYGAPVSYTLHNMFGPPEFDWNKLKGEPVRFNCRDKGLELLSDPVLVEDVTFSSISNKDQIALASKPKKLEFVVDANRIERNEVDLYDEFKRGNLSKQQCTDLARETAHSLSGIAFWPRLILDDTTVIDSRHYGDGNHQKSHWQTVLPIMAGRPVPDLVGGERVSVNAQFNWSTDVSKPCTYRLDGTVTRSA